MNFTGNGIITPIAPKVFGISKEHTFNGAGVKFVGLGRRCIWVASETEYTKMIISRVLAIKSKGRSGKLRCLVRRMLWR